jgi:hypothetical protein
MGVTCTVANPFAGYCEEACSSFPSIDSSSKALLQPKTRQRRRGHRLAVSARRLADRRGRWEGAIEKCGHVSLAAQVAGANVAVETHAIASRPSKLDTLNMTPPGSSGQAV